jgi:hypothetical protein
MKLLIFIFFSATLMQISTLSVSLFVCVGIPFPLYTPATLLWIRRLLGQQISASATPPPPPRQRRHHHLGNAVTLACRTLRYPSFDELLPPYNSTLDGGGAAAAFARTSLPQQRGRDTVLANSETVICWWSHYSHP